MRFLIVVLVFIAVNPVFAFEKDRYLQPNKVLYENPREDDVLKINTTIGYTTVLVFPDKPTMVTTGDSSLLQIEVPKNSRNVLVKALRESGETNLFVFTPDQRFNYKVFVGETQNVDYVIDVKEVMRNKERTLKKLPLNQLMKMARNYKVLKESDQINKRNFVQKDVFTQYENSNILLKMIEVFSNQAPHYLIVHAVIHNNQYVSIDLNERVMNVYVNGRKFKPKYVLLDSTTLGSRQETDAWLVLEDTHISLDNQFTIGVGVYDKEYIF